MNTRKYEVKSMTTGVLLIVATYLIVAVILVTIILHLITKHHQTEIEREVEQLDKEKNLIASTPVLSELSKVEAIVKNDKMEERYKDWQRRFEQIKEEKLVRINDMIIDLDLFVENKDIKNLRLKIAKTEMEIYKARTAANKLLSEVQEITVSEEKYRHIITKLKTKYRELLKEFHDHESDYKDIKDAISLQFENIERRFADFEETMENNEYSEVVHIVKALDTMISHMGIVVSEVPNLVLLAEELIPSRILEIKNTSETMIESGYSLDYLNIPYNIEASEKNISNILDRIKVLNLEDCMFELKTMLDYLDSLFNDFEKETIARKVYDENVNAFEEKLSKINSLLENIYVQMPDIKNMYDLKENDVKVIDELKGRLLAINVNYKALLEGVNNHETPYSKAARELETISNLLNTLQDDLDISLKNLGSMYDDETRAKEQKDELANLLKEAKNKIKSYKLPIITDNYYVELSEAKEAIREIERELNNKPIVIKTLNTRVDTARDLAIKLYNTANEMVKTAEMAEMAIVYGNRYRSDLKEIDTGLTNATTLFYKGKYRSSLECAIHAIELMEPEISKSLVNLYKD